jgi:hypothetical protein
MTANIITNVKTQMPNQCQKPKVKGMLKDKIYPPDLWRVNLDSATPASPRLAKSDQGPNDKSMPKDGTGYWKRNGRTGHGKRKTREKSGANTKTRKNMFSRRDAEKRKEN